MNHDFRGQNVVFGHFEHPRYGLIRSIRASRDIAAGEEIFADYGYGQPTDQIPNLHDWYFRLKKAYLAERGWTEQDYLDQVKF